MYWPALIVVVFDMSETLAASVVPLRLLFLFRPEPLSAERGQYRYSKTDSDGYGIRGLILEKAFLGTNNVSPD